VIDYLVEYWRVLWGSGRAYDQEHIRALVRHDVARARNFAAAQNHAILSDEDRPRAPLSSITAPALVIHGSDDPMFPLEHGSALANEIPGARLLALPGAGHGIDPADWNTVIEAIIAHTQSRGRQRGCGEEATTGIEPV
jgi:pimeloyl-ACP methyl ester carboxylesterase